MHVIQGLELAAALDADWKGDTHIVRLASGLWFDSQANSSFVPTWQLRS